MIPLIISVFNCLVYGSDLTEEDRAALAAKVSVITLPVGGSVYKYGQRGHFLYVVIKGAVEELFEHLDPATGDYICEPGPVYMSGQFFGEQALITEMPYPSSMTCIGK